MSTPTPPGARGNGLPAASTWVRIGECDPRIADELLDALAVARIPAYAQPYAGTLGGYLDRRPPHRPIDRVFVDLTRRGEAEHMLRLRLGPDDPGPGVVGPTGETGTPAGSASDELFAAIVAGWDEPAAPGSWPAAEDLSPGAGSVLEAPRPPEGFRPASPEPGLLDPGGLLHDSVLGEGHRPRSQDPFEGDDHHYEPPPPPRPPTLSRATKGAWVAILFGILVLVAPALGLFAGDRLSQFVGVALIAGGVVSLVLHLRDEDCDHPDDGAVV